VAEETTTVAFVKETTQRLSECISRIDLASEVVKNKMVSLPSFLNIEPLDVNMVSLLSGFAIVDYLNGRLFVLK
jgi:hypothetical protein